MNIPLHIVLIDDEPFQSRLWKMLLEKKYKERIRLEVYNDPQEAILHLNSKIDFLIIDWIMPDMNGAEVLKQAKLRGVNSEKIIILSGRPSAALHQHFSIGECLAVIEKGSVDQKIALYRILDELLGIPVY